VTFVLSWLDARETVSLYLPLFSVISSNLRTGDSRHDVMHRAPPPPLMTSESSGDANEEEKIQAMFQQSSEFWEKTQEQMAA
jgi:hypothetical protein